LLDLKLGGEARNLFNIARRAADPPLKRWVFSAKEGPAGIYIPNPHDPRLIFRHSESQIQPCVEGRALSVN